MAIVAVGLTFWRAWVCDDAYITFRVVRNTLEGHGPVFNPGERVQAFTHPLWYGLLLIGGFVWSNLHGLAVTLGLLLTAGSFLALGWTLRPPRHAGTTDLRDGFGLNRASLLLFAGSILLLASPSFLEFQTSGLENALTHALLFALLCHLLVTDSPGASARPAFVFLLGGLVVMNRPDQVWLMAPLLGWMAVRLLQTERRGLALALPALLPPVAWYAFAAVYYGTPLPNPAYAKMCEIGWHFGLLYAREFVRHEPLSAAVVLAAMAAAPVWCVARWRSGRPLSTAWPWLSLGITMQAAYVIWVGGDFMRGRFFLSCLVCAVFVLVAAARDVLPERDYGRPLAGILLAAFPAVWLIRLIEYLPVGPMTGFVSWSAQERLTRWACIVAAAVWATGALLAAFFARRRTGWSKRCTGVVILHGLVVLCFVGYREIDWSAVAAYSVLLVLSLLLLWRHVSAGGSSPVLLAAAGLAVAVGTSLQFNAYVSLSLGNGIVREYDFYRGAWDDARFRRPDATVQPGVPKLLILGRAARAYSQRFGPIALCYTNAGFVGWEAGPDVHLVDWYGLVDAFIARSSYLPSWRPGHVWHTPPREYLETLGAVNLLPDWESRLAAMDPRLREDALAMAAAARQRAWSDPREQSRSERTRLVVARPIWSRERLGALRDFMSLRGRR